MIAAALLCVSAAGFATVWTEPEPVVVDVGALTIDPAKGLRMHEGEPFTGVAHRLHTNGSLAQADSFVDGLRHGSLKVWFPDGRLGSEMHFFEGLRHGASRTWWANGSPRTETLFVEDRQEGEAWVWYSTGEKYKRHNYENGKPVGLQQAWRKNGKLYENFEIRGGRAYGLRNSKICYEVQETST